MKKRNQIIILFIFLAISLTSFVYLNAGNPEFSLFSINTEIPRFNVSESHLPDVEAVKNTLSFIKELLLFDL